MTERHKIVAFLRVYTSEEKALEMAERFMTLNEAQSFMNDVLEKKPVGRSNSKKFYRAPRKAVKEWIMDRLSLGHVVYREKRGEHYALCSCSKVVWLGIKDLAGISEVK